MAFLALGRPARGRTFLLLAVGLDDVNAAKPGAPQGLSYGQRQSEQMVNKGLSVAAKYIKFR
ncbi:hypothetical protein, partial [Sphingomonas sp. BE138]|uniref:hypothetical protein n=1 Tax=Sphingomonas sp. BE138 TaxID=2817845 RepID=UPI00286CDB92